jgi:hypothetical protein
MRQKYKNGGEREEKKKNGMGSEERTTNGRLRD